MKPIVVPTILLMANVCTAQSSLKPDHYRLDSDKPLLRQRDAPTNSWLIRSEREGVTAPAILWPEEHRGMKALMMRRSVKDSLRIITLPTLDSLPVFDRIDPTLPQDRIERELRRPTEDREK